MNIEEAIKILDKFTTEHKLFNIKHSNGLEESIETLLTAYEKEKEKNKELEKEKETNQRMIHLAETQILGYGQGYKDGSNKEITASEIVARERENQIIYEGMKHKLNMEWVLKIKAKIEELDKQDKESKLSHNYLVIPVLQSLLEKE